MSYCIQVQEKNMITTYRLPQCIPSFTISEVISIDRVSGRFSAGFEHVHKKAWEAVFSIAGDIYVLVGSEWLKIKKNECIIIQPGTVHDVRLRSEKSDTVVFSFIPEGAFNVPSDTVLTYSETEKDILLKMIDELTRLDDKDDTTNSTEVHQMLCDYLEQFSVLMMRKISGNGNREAVHTEKTAGNYDYVVDQVNAYISKHAADCTSVSDMAKRFHYNRTALYRIYKSVTGESLITVITRQQIRTAKELLENEELPISEITKLSGFHSMQYFSKRFRQVTGFTPSEYRKQLRNKE